MCYNMNKKGVFMNITIPEFPLPFPIPELIHPFIVHFAIALPVIWLLLEFINLFAKRRILSGTTLFLALLSVVVFFGAYLTGKTDAKAANVTLETLSFHKELGVYLVYGSVAVLFLKLLSFLIAKTQMRVLFILSLMIFIGVTCVEGKKGGELVYQYGVNVKTTQATKTATAPTSTNSHEKKKEETKEEQASQTQETKEAIQNTTHKEESKETNNHPTPVAPVTNKEMTTQEQKEEKQTITEETTTNTAVETNQTQEANTETTKETKQTQTEENSSQTQTTSEVNTTTTSEENTTTQSDTNH